MGFADDFFAVDVSAFADAYGESITYTPAGGSPVAVTAVVVRGVLSPVSELGGKVGAVHHELTIARSAIASISKGDQFSFANHVGGTATVHSDIQIDQERTDAGAWVLKVR
jgi:hypothetical protein